MAQGALKSSVRQFLAAHHMLVDEDWLSGCVEFLTEDNNNETEIKNLAREQWLLNDLKDICPGSLPKNLSSQVKTVLNGRYVLQINAAVDIGTPAYQQYLKLQKVNMENVEATTKYEDKISNHRMIKLYMTDGVQEVTAIEYKQMRNISCDITPGCKILLKGPIECRRGMLLLTEANVELLGGEVQEIAVSNSLAGLISSKLGLPMTQEPHPSRPPAIPAAPSLPPPASRPVARVTSVQQSEFNDEDIDLDQLTAIENNLDNPVKRPLTNASTSQQKKPRTDISSTNIQKSRQDAINTNQKHRTDFSSTNTQTIDLTSANNDYPTDEDLLFEDEDYLREIEAELDAKENGLSVNPVEKRVGPISVSEEPFVYIKQINSMKDSEKCGRVFKVKGQIMKLLSKLSVGKEGWSLKCSIVDGTASIDVEFTSDVLSKLVGYTPQEMNQLKKQIAAKPELKEKAVSALQKAKDNLQVLYCIIELTMLEVPRITRLEPFGSNHLQKLDERLKLARV